MIKRSKYGDSTVLDRHRPYSKEELKAMLPKVGDTLMRRQTICCPGMREPSKLKNCKVVYVNEEHMYYTVQFQNGCRESFKVPEKEGRKRINDSDGWGW